MTEPQRENHSEVSALPNPRLRLHYLDGLRGLAALYVVLYHCYMQVPGNIFTASSPLVARIAIQLLSFGHISVDIFIVLSGYCLMLPVARSSDRQLSGSISKFFQRRAMRILPPYYAALLITVLLIWYVPALGERSGANWDIALPAFTQGVMISHLLLIHNLSPSWMFKVDIPMWSVATEWQIYFLFPILLLPVWRRSGGFGLVLVSFVFWMAIHILFHARFDGACLHFLSLFSFGMVAAAFGFRQRRQEAPWRGRVSWGIVTITLFLCLFSLLSCRPQLIEKHTSQVDLLAGVCTASLLVYCTQHLMGKATSRSAVLVVLESRFAVGLGRFSYSLYLIHAPVLAFCYALLRERCLASTTILVLEMLVGVPFSLLFSYLFFMVCERPFLARQGSGSVTPALTTKPELFSGIPS